jgi:hypothetical protein
MRSGTKQISTDISTAENGQNRAYITSVSRSVGSVDICSLYSQNQAKVPSVKIFHNFQDSIRNESNNVLDSSDKLQEQSNRTLKNNSQGDPTPASDRSDRKQTLLESNPTITTTSVVRKCFYCDEWFEGNDGNDCDINRINHIDTEHPGKLHHPTPEDFENRLER